MLISESGCFYTPRNQKLSPAHRDDSSFFITCFSCRSKLCPYATSAVSTIVAREVGRPGGTDDRGCFKSWAFGFPRS